MIMFLTFRGKGNEKSKKAAFRECFFKIGDMRSLLPQGTPVLALTATATSEVISDTMKGLAMKDDTYQIRVSPDRPNIFLYNRGGSRGGVEGVATLPFENFFFLFCLILRKIIIE